MSKRKAKYYLEDTIRHKKHNINGVVTKVWHDVENAPGETDYSLNEGEFEVCWLDDYGTFTKRREDVDCLEYGQEDDEAYELLDRSFSVGDVCKQDSSAATSGVVQGGSMKLSIRNLATREEKCVSCREIMFTTKYEPGDYVIKDDWLGKVQSADYRAIVKFPNGAALDCDMRYIDAVQYDDDDFFYPAQLQTGTIVRVSSTGMRRAKKATSGPNAPLDSSFGVVCVSYNSKVQVKWQFQNMMVESFAAKPEPRGTFGTKDLRNGALTVSQASASTDLSYQIGDVVIEKAVNNTPKGLDFYATSTPDKLKEICNEWEIFSTEQRVNVLWQNEERSEHLSRDLVPYLNVDDLDVWPYDSVFGNATTMMGFVQTVNAEDRIARVKWVDGKFSDMSLYELRSNGGIEISLGDLVLITPEQSLTSEPTEEQERFGLNSMILTAQRLAALNGYRPEPLPRSAAGIINWFGQVVSMDVDGFCDVCLCYSKDQPTIRLSSARLIHFASDSSSEESSSDDSEFEIDSTDSESSAYASEEVPWVDDTGKPIDDENGWSDADEEMVDYTAAEPVPIHDIILDEPAPAIKRVTREAEACEKEVVDAAQPVKHQADAYPDDPIHFSPFQILDNVPTDHTFISSYDQMSNMKRIQKEYKTLKSSLPSGILVRSFETRLDLLRVMILGPLDTPYEYAPMLFDLSLPPDFPQSPPLVHFFSWTNGIGRINPNLYEDGKVCLSLLGTWHGTEESETWTSESTLLQLLVSLQALVLVKEPYYNEAGYDILSGGDTAVASAMYSERAYLLTRGFVSHALENPIEGLNDEIRWYYLENKVLALIKARAEEVINASTSITKGAKLLLKKQILSYSAFL